MTHKPKSAAKKTSVRSKSFSGPVTVPDHASARAALQNDPSAVVIVRRAERDRSVSFLCPCGCGEALTLNVDLGAGRAWRLVVEKGELTLLPSVWRDTGCQSHFVVWRNRIWWFGFDESDDYPLWPARLRNELRTEWEHLRLRRDQSAISDGEDN